MVRTIFHKVMWVGKAAVFTAGMAMILALVFGVATTALGATGGNFILGKANVAERGEQADGRHIRFGAAGCQQRRRYGP